MQILHTVPCPLPGPLAQLQLTFDLGMSQSDYGEALARNEPAPALVDSPNWEAVTGQPRPAFPLTDGVLAQLPLVLMRYLISLRSLQDALDAYQAQYYGPNSSSV